jgi:hypothetical protein
MGDEQRGREINHDLAKQRSERNSLSRSEVYPRGELALRPRLHRRFAHLGIAK